MTHTVAQIATEFRTALKAQPGPAGRDKVCNLLKEVLVDQDFIKATFDDNTPERKILHEDPSTAHIPIMALSANAVPHDIEKGLEAGFFRYLTKPINVNEFMDALDVALHYATENGLASKEKTL